MSDFIKEIKTSSNKWIKNSGSCPHFESWAEGFCGITYNIKDKDMLINYIKNQKVHHKVVSVEDEIREILEENQIPWEEKYIF